MGYVIWLDMKGIISNVLEWCKKNNKTLLDAQKYLKKKNIKVSLEVLKKRFKDIKVIKRGKEWDWIKFLIFAR